MSVAISNKDEIVMQLVHYFVTEEDYEPIIVNGVNNEIWLENLEAPYKVIRINSNYIHNEEQYKFDVFKIKNIVKQIKKKTFSLKMKMDAMRRQGARVDVEGTCGNDCHKLGIKTADIVGDTVGLKGRQVRNYVRLTYLSPELLEMVDQKKIQFVIAVDLSYLDEQIQKWVYEYIKDNGFIKAVQISALKNYPNLSNATQQSVISIMNDALPKKSVSAKITFSEKKLDKYFPSHFSSKDRENTIIQLLEKWSVEQGQTI